VTWHTRLALLLLGWRRKTRAACSSTASHDALEQVGRTMSNSRRLRLRRASGTSSRTTTLLKLVTKTRYFFLISKVRQ
jgi:hypothetical protein